MGPVSNRFGLQEFSKIKKESISRRTVETVFGSGTGQNSLTLRYVSSTTLGVGDGFQI
jgi:hypothetical protein